MGCFPCFRSSKKAEEIWKTGGEVVYKKEASPVAAPAQHEARVTSDESKPRGDLEAKEEESIPKEGNAKYIAAQIFSFREVASATNNFQRECLLGEGGFGRVYKGCLRNGQVVAVKKLNRNGLQGNREFLVEVLMLSLLHHPNLVNLIGYCADGDQRLLVYEYMPLKSLEDHLHDLPHDRQPLDWNIRMKIAAGAANGLEYLHDKANPPVIYRDLKSSNILLDEGYHPKLSDFGLAKLGPVGDKTHVSTRVMGTYGYCAPEYAMTGQLTQKSDVYSFGVVLLELITGRKAIDNTLPVDEQNLVAWARPLFKDRKKFPKMADPLLQGRYPIRGLYQALAIAAMCLQEQAAMRPVIGDIVTALKYLVAHPYDINATTPKNNRASPSTHGVTEDWKTVINGSENQHLVHSPIRYSPGKRKVRGVNIRANVGRADAADDSGRKWGVEDLVKLESQGDSPGHAGKAKTSTEDLDLHINRERAVAEAKVWGENWRDRKRNCTAGSFDSTNE